MEQQVTRTDRQNEQKTTPLASKEEENESTLDKMKDYLKIAVIVVVAIIL